MLQYARGECISYRTQSAISAYPIFARTSLRWLHRPLARQRLVSPRVFVALVILVVLLLGLGGIIYSYLSISAPLNQIVGQQASCSRGIANNANTGRINVLLLGSDNDEKFQGQPLAQTNIIATIDPSAKTVGLVSIPRDFFLNVPGYGMHKLDEAYSLGGVSLSCLTIQQDFGIPLNYYAWVGLDGFIRVIDTVGGVDVNVTHAIVDDNYPDDINNKSDPYALQRLYIPPGPQHLDGQTALQYVRSRHADLVGDFGRSARQQQVLLALKSKLDNSSIISKLPTIANELKGSVKTDMQLSNVLQLVNFARDLNPSAIQRVTLGPPYSTAGTAPADAGSDSGVSVVFPNCPKVIAALQGLFGQSAQPVCNIQGNPGTTLRSSSSPSTLPGASPASSSIARCETQNANSCSTTIQMFEASSGDGPYAYRAVLALQLLVVFESPDALFI